MFTDHWQPGWQDCYTSYIRQLWERSHSDATPVNYGGVLKHFFEACGKEPQFVTRADVEVFVSSLQIRRNIGSPPSARTRNNRLTVLSSFFTYSCGFEYVDGFGKLAQLSDRNPCMGIKQSRTSVVHHSMTLDEFRCFMAAIPQDGEPIHLRDRALFLTLFLTCRTGDHGVPAEKRQDVHDR